MYRTWQKFEEMQHTRATREKELLKKADRLEADAAFVNTALEENSKLKDEAEAAKQVVAEVTKEAKEIREALRTCGLDRDYHKEVIEKKIALACNLQDNLQVESSRCKQLASEVQALKEEKSRLLEEHVEEIEDNKDVVKIYFYMFWKHNRNADFSYLTHEAFVADEAECLERLAEEEVEAAKKDASP